MRVEGDENIAFYVVFANISSHCTVFSFHSYANFSEELRIVF